MDDRDENLQWAIETLGQEAVDRVAAMDRMYQYLNSSTEPARILPIVEHEDLPAEFLDVVKVKIVGWRPVTYRRDGHDIRVLKADWTLVPKDWPGKEDGAIKPVYPASSSA